MQKLRTVIYQKYTVCTHVGRFEQTIKIQDFDAKVGQIGQANMHMTNFKLVCIYV